MKIPFFVVLVLVLAACASGPPGPAISQSPIPGGLHLSANVPVSPPGACVVGEKDVVLTIQGANVTGNDELGTPLHGTADSNHFSATGSNMGFGRAMTINVSGDIVNGKVTKVRLDEQKNGGTCEGEVRG